MMKGDELLTRLLALYPARDTTGFNYLDLLHIEGSPLSALLYVRLFWPKFVEYEGMVFMADTIEDDEDRARVRHALDRYLYDKTQVEMAFNTVEVPSLFGRSMMESSDEDDIMLAKSLAVMWRCALTEQFPGRLFEVRVLTPSESGSEVAVVFHQVTK